MATQVVDTEGHIFEKDEVIYEYLEAPYHGRKELLAQPFFPGLDGFHRIARRGGDSGSYILFIVGAHDPQAWRKVLDQEAIDRTVIYPTSGLASGVMTP